MFYIGRRVQVKEGSFAGYIGWITGQAGGTGWTVRNSPMGPYKIFAESNLIAL